MPGALQPGDVLRGRYQIRERIGQGGMGNIYLADDLRLAGRRTALKEVEHDRTVPRKILQETREQFLREATVLARLDHPNLPKVSDFFTIATRDYLVMDYVPGDDLRTIMIAAIQRGKYLDETNVLRWAKQLCSALNYLHHQDPPLVHRDIKPSNLKVTPDGLLKLVDFGLVKALAPDDMTVTVIQGRGTALYTPLEQYGGDGRHTDARSDIYALGATFYHLLTNTAPLDARERFLHPGVMQSPRRLNPSINIRTDRSILWAMELHPDQRPSSIEVFSTSLFGGIDYPGSSINIPIWKQVIRDMTHLPEQILFWLTCIFTFISLIATMIS